MATFKQESRYRNATVTEIAKNGEVEEYVVLRKISDIPLTGEDKYVTITQQSQFRPDIISNEVYGTPDYGWAIMETNNIRSFVELKQRLRLRIPPLSSLRQAIQESNNVT